MHLYGQNKLVNTAQNAYLDTNDYINKDRNQYEIKRKLWKYEYKSYFFYKSRNLINQYVPKRSNEFIRYKLLLQYQKKSNLYRFLPSQIALIKCHISEFYL